MDEVSRRIVDNTARRAAAAGGAPKPRFNDQFNFDVMFPQVGEHGAQGMTWGGKGVLQWDFGAWVWVQRCSQLRRCVPASQR